MKITGKLFFIYLLITPGLGVSFASPQSKILPADLQCELRKEPLGVDVSNPGLSYIVKAINDSERGLRQTAYQILVSSSAALLKNDKGDLWNSGRITSGKMAYINYGGKTLHSSQQCWWKLRVWDQAGRVSEWSQPASWTMGILHETDWKGSWLTAEGADKFALSPFGYKAMVSEKQTTVKWVQVDLQQIYPLDQIRLVPMFFEDRAGYGFPVNFKLEVSNDPQFGTATTVADYRSTPLANPGWKPANFKVKNITARYIRVTPYKLWGTGKNFNFALRQIAVLYDGKNIASGKPVEAFDSQEEDGWTKNNLTDEPSDRSALPNYSSMLLRKEFSVGNGLVRALIHVSGLSEYELTINGEKTGDFLLAPGWTNYLKTILYDTYDITRQLQKGTNAIGIMLGNGMYNIQPDSIRYVKFLNSFGPLKAIAHLRLEYADGSVKIVGTDASWQVSPGPVTYSNMFGGEDFDANLETAGWNKPFFKKDDRWKPALVTISPGGKLKGLSAAALPVKVIETIKPVKVTKLNNNIWIYDCGQNASMMPKISVTGPKGSYVRIIPAELLGKDGFADRRSATQDGARPAWWQYTLSGNGIESWKPKFFYQGARYLQVELFPAKENGQLPRVDSLEDLVVHAASTAIGTFSCDNDLFNRIYELVRWAQRSNMMSLMTDCPHREKMGWLEENHLNGPSLRYNFDMAPLFRKNMNDMVDAQLKNGFVPNIAPEYFIAGSADLTNGFRNSPEWGSSFIIVPWQQYLFSGDISLLERYYDKMKDYVAFLSSTAKNNIIHVGLGDWYDLGPKAPWGSQLTPVPFTATAIFYYDNWILSQVAHILNREEDAKAFKKTADEIRIAFNKEFYKPAIGQYGTGSQTCNAMPLFLNLAETGNRGKLIAAIVADIRKRGNGLTSGDVGYRFLLKALAGEGRSDVIFDMNNQSERPGYGYQLKMGATSLTEKWDAGVGDFGSQNHFMLGQINEWFFNDLAGIGPDEQGAGFRKIIIKPSVTVNLNWVKAAFASVSGNIISEWRKDKGRLQMNITIPPNTTATVYVPSKKEGGVTESGKAASGSKGVKYIKYYNGHSIYNVQSGSYQFNTDL
ncbi:MAG: family 78 glycoside hydrolase catalytic domain [Ferruginibacter sp.]|nr:family 78 glycoside hydrolase catalytic domain [Ferruginibacter sp.]